MDSPELDGLAQRSTRPFFLLFAETIRAERSNLPLLLPEHHRVTIHQALSAADSLFVVAATDFNAVDYVPVIAKDAGVVSPRRAPWQMPTSGWKTALPNLWGAVIPEMTPIH